MGFKSLELWKKYAKNGELIPMLFFKLGGKRMVSDEYQIRNQYKAITGKKLNLDNPKSFNEKIQWLKLHDRNPLYCTMVDKYEVKKYVAEIIGEEYIIPTLGVWNTFDDIDFDSLPQQFVLKCTHDSGGIVIVKDKATMDLASARKKIEKSLKTNYYYVGREWPYKDVKPRIIAEKYMADSSSVGINDYKISNFDRDTDSQLTDYKIHCFNGIPKIILVCKDRYSADGMSEDFYTLDWKHIAVKRPKKRNSTCSFSKPTEVEKMLEISEKLSTDIPFIRVDFYIVDNHIYLGELTLYPASGFELFEPNTFDYELGNYLRLSTAR